MFFMVLHFGSIILLVQKTSLKAVITSA